MEYPERRAAFVRLFLSPQPTRWLSNVNCAGTFVKSCTRCRELKSLLATVKSRTVFGWKETYLTGYAYVNIGTVLGINQL